MADYKPTVTVVKDSVDEQALKQQYGDNINYNYGTNQFVGADRNATNQQYQNYLSSQGVNPVNTGYDLSQLNGVRIVNGGVVNTQGQPTYDSNSEIGNIDNSLRQMRDAYVQTQQAGLSTYYAQQIRDLESAYATAISEGQISIRDAESAFNDAVSEINKNAYLASQQTSLYANRNGITNSQQMIGLMQGDASRKAGLINTIMTTRDKRIADIKDRLTALNTQKNLDLVNAKSKYDAGLLNAQGQADLSYAQGMLGLRSDNLNAQRGQQFNLDNMAIQHGYDVDMAKMQFEQQRQLQQEQLAGQAALQRAAASGASDNELLSTWRAYNEPDSIEYQVRTSQEDAARYQANNQAQFEADSKFILEHPEAATLAPESTSFWAKMFGDGGEYEANQATHNQYQAALERITAQLAKPVTYGSK